MNKHRGVTLLETLIAILVLSFGMLGMLGIIINSLKMTSSSNYRTIAAEQAYAMADYARGTPALLADYAAPASSANTVVKAQFDQWTENLDKSLPAGKGMICRDASPEDNKDSTDWKCDGTGQYVVKVCWNESRIALSTATNSNYSTSGEYCTWTNI